MRLPTHPSACGRKPHLSLCFLRQRFPRWRLRRWCIPWALKRTHPVERHFAICGKGGFDLPLLWLNELCRREAGNSMAIIKDRISVISVVHVRSDRRESVYSGSAIMCVWSTSDSLGIGSTSYILPSVMLSIPVLEDCPFGPADDLVSAHMPPLPFMSPAYTVGEKRVLDDFRSDKQRGVDPHLTTKWLEDRICDTHCSGSSLRRRSARRRLLAACPSWPAFPLHLVRHVNEHEFVTCQHCCFNSEQSEYHSSFDLYICFIDSINRSSNIYKTIAKISTYQSLFFPVSCQTWKRLWWERLPVGWRWNLYK